uniref:Putative secreted protein n=1 Tax=Ixodes ricinus TaxID=34613 RepID=A0A6B0U9D0_IXORI
MLLSFLICSAMASRMFFSMAFLICSSNRLVSSADSLLKTLLRSFKPWMATVTPLICWTLNSVSSNWLPGV